MLTSRSGLGVSRRGPVQSVDEKTNLQAQAVAVGGDLSVVNNLEVVAAK
jgi:hypothetical protein